MKPRRDIAVVVLAAGAFAVAMSLQIMRDRWYPRDDIEREQILYVRSGAALKRIALSFDAVAADVYWIRAIQHYGGERLSGTGPKAGGPRYLERFAVERTVTINTAAAGGNATLLAAIG